jgi:hypothetical protein
VVPIDGYPVGILTHVALSANHNAVGGDDTWPPGGGVAVRPFTGAVVRHRGLVNIIFAITGTVIGRTYQAAGLKVRYRYQGQVYSTIAWSVAVACLVSNAHAPFTPRCTKDHEQAMAKVRRKVGNR